MQKLKQRKSMVGLLGVFVVFFLVFPGCLGSKLQKRNTSPNATKNVAKTKDIAPTPLYRDFEDVLIPGELKVDMRSTSVYKISGSTAGILSLNGRVELNSLVSFFENNMAKDNWRALGSFKSSRTMLLFQKENRWCSIHITEKEFKIYIEIWVIPSIDEIGTGLLK